MLAYLPHLYKNPDILHDECLVLMQFIYMATCIIGKLFRRYSLSYIISPSVVMVNQWHTRSQRRVIVSNSID
jgi:hypothetical protein